MSRRLRRRKYRLEVTDRPELHPHCPITFFYVDATCKEMARVLFWTKVWWLWAQEIQAGKPQTRYALGKVEQV